ncbi:MAG: chemotaxis protein CheW [Bacteroidetes bacterium]|nr:chemotaxis protein CheW [Bacteroidota bacterium]
MSPIRTEKEILKERAQKLAVLVHTDKQESAQNQSMVGFYLAPGHYCLESAYLREVVILKELTMIPGVPPFIQGIIIIRGQVMSLMNLRKFLDLKETGISEQNKIMIVCHKGMEIGILVDRIEGMFKIDPSSVDPALPHFGGLGAEFVKGVTREGVIVLDCAAMLESKKIIVQDNTNQ